MQIFDNKFDQQVANTKPEETINIPVLVIDDDDFMLDIIREALEMVKASLHEMPDKSYTCSYQLYNNEEDFEAAITSETHIAIIDHLLGGVHVGLEVIDRFEKKRKTKIPSRIIVVSGQVSEDIMIRYINEKKVDAYIKKPPVKDGIEGIRKFQNEVKYYTQEAIKKTIVWFNWFASYEKFM